MTETRWLLIGSVVQDDKLKVHSNVGAFNNGINYWDPKSLSLKHHLGCNCQHTTCDSIQTYFWLTYSVTCHSKYIRAKREKTVCTLFLYLSDLFHSFLQDCTFVRLDIEIVDVIEVGENELSELFDVFVLLLTVALLIAPLGTKKRKKILNRVWMSWKTLEMHTWTSTTATK